MNTNFVMGNKRDAKLKLQYDNYMSILKKRQMIMHSLKLQAPAPAPVPVNHDENAPTNKPKPTKNKFNILLSKMNKQNSSMKL